jgi:hypothetical protein
MPHLFPPAELEGVELSREEIFVEAFEGYYQGTCLHAGLLTRLV